MKVGLIKPSFIGEDYFCDTGYSGMRGSSSMFNPLWDGEGCGPTNACCEFNNPPWFCTTLPQPTTDNIELRNCADQDVMNEDTVISFVELHIMA